MLQIIGLIASISILICLLLMFYIQKKIFDLLTKLEGVCDEINNQYLNILVKVSTLETKVYALESIVRETSSTTRP